MFCQLTKIFKSLPPFQVPRPLVATRPPPRPLVATVTVAVVVTAQADIVV